MVTDEWTLAEWETAHVVLVLWLGRLLDEKGLRYNLEGMPLQEAAIYMISIYAMSLQA